MSELADHPLTQALVLLAWVMGGIIAVKAGASYLPDSGAFGAIKKVVSMV